MNVLRVDHLVLTVASIRRSIEFYERLGFKHVATEDRHAMRFGDAKVNLHPAEHPYSPAASRPTPGSGDICFVVAEPASQIMALIAAAGVEIELGPIERHGALGPMTSVYVRDPDANLLEFASYSHTANLASTEE